MQNLTAKQIAARANAALDRMIENADPRDWTERHRHEAYVAALRDGHARATGARQVTVTMSPRFAQKGADAIDAAVEFDGPIGEIHEPRPGVNVFTW